jgi:hypothetical protein
VKLVSLLVLFAFARPYLDIENTEPLPEEIKKQKQLEQEIHKRDCKNKKLISCQKL